METPMKFNKKFLLVVPVFIITIAAIRFIKDKIGPFRVSGTVEATQVIVSARLNSALSEILIQEGDLVKKGDVLMKLDCEDVTINFERSREDFERIQKLYRSGTTSQESLDKVRTVFLDSQVRRNWCTVRSPIDGVVVHRFREAGEVVAPGTRLLSVLDPHDYWVYFYLPHNLIHRMKIGEQVKTLLPEAGKAFFGKIIKINEYAEFTPKNVQTFDERTRLVYGVKVMLHDIGNTIKPGMSLDFEIEK